MRPDTLLRLWGGAAGFALFLPAVAVPGLGLPLQPMDLLVIAGLPLALLALRKASTAIVAVCLGLLLSQGLSLIVAGGQALILAHSVLLVIPFLILTFSVARDAGARKTFLRGFLTGGAISALLFMAQMIFGAERLDWRSNTGFSLPPQYGRAFALFPEVSTYAVHMILVLAVCLMALRPGARVWAPSVLFVLALLTLLLSRSSSFLLLLPPLVLLAVILTQRISARGLLGLLGLCLGLTVLLAVFFHGFYAARLETAAASRSADMRLASILGGLSPLVSWDIFGVGPGENHEITRMAFDMSRQFDLRFGALPKGINSHIVSRIFEEGWPAVGHMGFGLWLLGLSFRMVPRASSEASLLLIAVGSLLGALLVIGYRGIYLNWLWLSFPAGLIAAYLPDMRRTTPTVLTRIQRSSRRAARRA